ncbi:hypothetical protein MVEN_02296000 [Mycena venus]|uniref:Hydrophobic surface binding protein n=1 Tax=Mycena venus TaxID=2733690 RepID=A0A8H6X5T5_9AGAR|nr:hypothetical protein MVEN_02296000 [Mycena venus]
MQMISLLYLALITLTASGSVLKSRDVEPAEMAMREIVQELDTILVDVILLTPGDLAASQNIENHFSNVTDLTGNATLQIEACVSKEGLATTTDALAMLIIAEDEFSPTLFDTLNRTAAAAPLFSKEGFGDQLRNDLIRYNATNAKYLQALISGTPPGLVPNATVVEREVVEAFNRAIGAFGVASTTTAGTTSITTTTTTTTVGRSSSSATGTQTASTSSTIRV